MNNTKIKTTDISRKEAIKKIGTYSKYAALTALNPQKAQASSPIDNPGISF